MIQDFYGNFSSNKEFDKTTATKLKEFFDVDFVNRDINQYWQYFQNLSKLAYQNLGLAHCVVHNQSAQNATQLAYDATKFKCYQKPYGAHIGAYSFKKPARTENLVLDGKTLKGLKKWASQLHTADFMIIKVFDPSKRRRWVFIDLEKSPQIISNTRDNLLGMNAAKPSDIELNIELPDEWIVDQFVPMAQLNHVTNFHNYGLITNYMSNARSLLDLGTTIADKHGYNVDYNIKSLDLQIRILESLWITNIESTLEDLSADFWKIRDAQYQFGKKTLIDVIHFFLQITSSTMFDVESEETQIFRDALIFSSHITNLYTHVSNIEY